MSIAICTTVWGTFWDRFGAQFIEQMEKLNTEPDEVIVSSPVPLNLPKHWHEIVQPHNKWDCWNDTMFAARSEWVMPVGMDDIWFPDALDGLTDVEDDVDVISVPCMENGKRWEATNDGYNQLLELPYNPMQGAYLIRRSRLNAVPFRHVVYNDWMQFMEMKKLNYKITFKTMPIVDHIRRPDSYSIGVIPGGVEECEQMRQILLKYDVVPGTEFPPTLKECKTRSL